MENKQETLEEFAKSEAFEFIVDYKPFETNLDYRKYAEYGFEKGFIAGTKWQQDQDKKMYSEEEVLMKIKSVKLCMMAHPDNELNSEFADRISDLKEIEIELSKQQKVYSEEEVLKIIQECKAYLSFGDEFNEVKWFEQFKNK